MSIKKLMFALASAALATQNFAANPAVAYTEAGKFDSSFNEAVFRNGVTRFNAQFDAKVEEVEPKTPSHFVEVLTSLANQGRSPIVAVGFSYAESVAEVAAEFPETQFTIIDAVVDAPNVQSILFKEAEGSFLVGALAALKASGNDIGFVGGVDLPFISRFGCGYAQGAHYINSRIKVHSRMISDNFSGFSNPEGGYAAATELMQSGAEVIYAAAGRSGNGVYKAAASDNSVYAIGVDSSQNFLHVGTMLTSMVKKVGVAAYGAWEEAEKDTWQPGIKVLGLAENGVDWELDIFNRNLVTPKQEKEINKIRKDIISGKIKVVDYVDNGNQCPVALLTE